jgi:2-polyprenyl-3-methyl-5-hydroxy-6-metoxy-1,4-benzoquinol methylase
MPSFTNRSNKLELLDNPNIPFHDIRRNMQELDTINSLLGGHAITIAGVKKLLQHRQVSNISICEIGCGGGDNLRAIDKWLRKKNIQASYTGIDINPHCIEHARKAPGLAHAQWIVSDYKEVKFEKKPDIIFGSLFCHHFKNEDLVAMFRWMRQNAGLGFFINDLQRHWFAYHSIRLLTGTFSRSYMVRNDAPLSVLRGFFRKELDGLMQQAGVANHSIEWKWAFRWLLTCKFPY